MEQKLISPKTALPDEGEIVRLILFDNSSMSKVLDDFFISVFYDGNFLTGKRSIVPERMIYRGSPTYTYYHPFKEARNEIQIIINKDEDDEKE